MLETTLQIHKPFISNILLGRRKILNHANMKSNPDCV